jgi:DNA topoisomerase IA
MRNRLSRVLDRLVGYELSPVLWKKLKEDFQQVVQSFGSFNCGARKRYQNFNAVASYSIVASTNESGKSFKAKAPKKISILKRKRRIF